MPDRAAANERLADAVDADGGLHARGLAHALHGFLERDGVDHGRQHAHVVGCGAGNIPILGKRRPADEIPPAHNDGKLHAHLGDLDALTGDILQFGRFDAERALVTESLPTDFQENARISGGSGIGNRGLQGHGGIIAVGAMEEKRSEPRRREGARRNCSMGILPMSSNFVLQ